MFRLRRFGLSIAGVLMALPAEASGPLEAAQLDYYNARYEASAAATLDACATGGDIAACELRTAALLFQIKRLVGQAKDKDKAWKQCATCPELMTAFKAALARGQDVARTKLKEIPDDDETLFLLGKLDLN